MEDFRPTVAIFDGSDDTVEMLAEFLQRRGFRSVNGHVNEVKRGEVDFIAFMKEHDPQVLIWDISMPYDKNWLFFQLLRSSEALKGRGVVLTTTHKPNLDKLAGQETSAIEIVGKPFDLDLIATAVQNALPGEGIRSSARSEHPSSE